MRKRYPPPSKSKLTPASNPLVEHISLWTGVLGAVMGVVLSVYAAAQKDRVDALQLDLQEKAQEIEALEQQTEASRERVERYTWVRSLYADLDQQDERKMNFTISLIRLALTDEEETQLFAALQSSPNEQLRSAGQSGLSAIDLEPIALLVNRIDASTAEVRKSAVALLVREYRASSAAITLVLQRLEAPTLARLSPNGIINSLFFLRETDLSVWSAQQLETARRALDQIEAMRIGPQTQTAVTSLRSHLAQAEGL